jgi:hypothetical protein
MAFDRRSVLLPLATRIGPTAGMSIFVVVIVFLSLHPESISSSIV